MNKIKSFSEDISTGNEPSIMQDNQNLHQFSLNQPYDFEIDTEAEKKSSYQILKENRIPLTEEKRKIVMDRKAIWHHGPHGEKTPAVWKSKNSAGEIVYITNTHRAWNHSPTLLECINRYHKFIKGTA